jgi:hypothetical protein
MAFAGTVILVSLALAHWHSAYWLLPARERAEAARGEARSGVLLKVAPARAVSAQRDFRGGFVGLSP